TWLNEGLAVYEEYRHGVKPLISVLAVAYTNNSLLAWDVINAAFLDPSTNQVQLAYQQSFSFVYFLINKYGMSKMTALLKILGANPDVPVAVMQVYNVSLESLQDKWRIWLTGFINNWAEQPVALNY